LQPELHISSPSLRFARVTFPCLLFDPHSESGIISRQGCDVTSSKCKNRIDAITFCHCLSCQLCSISAVALSDKFIRMPKASRNVRRRIHTHLRPAAAICPVWENAFEWNHRFSLLPMIKMKSTHAQLVVLLK
jgi:hypothetical protein